MVLELLLPKQHKQQELMRKFHGMGSHLEVVQRAGSMCCGNGGLMQRLCLVVSGLERLWVSVPQGSSGQNPVWPRKDCIVFCELENVPRASLDS